MANREPLDSNTRKFVVIVLLSAQKTLRLLDAYEDSPDAVCEVGPPHRRFSCSSRAPALMRCPSPAPTTSRTKSMVGDRTPPPSAGRSARLGQDRRSGPGQPCHPRRPQQMEVIRRRGHGRARCGWCSRSSVGHQAGPDALVNARPPARAALLTLKAGGGRVADLLGQHCRVSAVEERTWGWPGTEAGCRVQPQRRGEVPGRRPGSPAAFSDQDTTAPPSTDAEALSGTFELAGQLDQLIVGQRTDIRLR